MRTGKEPRLDVYWTCTVFDAKIRLVYQTSTVLPRKKLLDGSCTGRGSALGPNLSQIFLLAPFCTRHGSALGPNPSQIFLLWLSTGREPSVIPITVK